MKDSKKPQIFLYLADIPVLSATATGCHLMMVISSSGTSHEDALCGSCTASQVAKLHVWHLTEQEQASSSRQMQCHFETQARKTAGRNSFKMPTPLLCSWQDNSLLVFAFQFFLFSLHKLSFLLFFFLSWEFIKKRLLKINIPSHGFHYEISTNTF